MAKGKKANEKVTTKRLVELAHELEGFRVEETLDLAARLGNNRYESAASILIDGRENIPNALTSSPTAAFYWYDALTRVPNRTEIGHYKASKEPEKLKAIDDELASIVSALLAASKTVEQACFKKGKVSK